MLLFVRLFLVAALLALPSRAWAQETYGVLTFAAPEEWARRPHEQSLEFLATDEETGGWGRIQVWRALPSLGSPPKDFKHDYDLVVARSLKPTRAPKTTLKTRDDGWHVTEARTTFTFGGRPGQVVFLSFSNGAIATSVAAMFNDTAFKDPIDAFLGSLRLEAPAAPEPVPGANEPAHEATPPANADARLFGRWQRSGSRAPHYADPVSWGTSGYTTSRYEFNADGTYAYTERSWRASVAHILIVKEQGTFTASDREIAVTPTRSVIEAYAKKNGVDELGALVSSTPRPLERTAYAYRFHFFEGLREWNLVMQSESATNRDGAFSSNTTYANAWYFNQRFVQTELTSPRGK